MQFKPHNYQKYCIYRIINDNTLGLFLDMGLGKTVITLTAINDLKYNRFEISKVLVIAPKKVAESTWSRETEKWEHLKLLRVSTVLGSEKKRSRALTIPADIFVINRENVPWLVEYYRNNWPFDMVVIDEFSSFKSQSAKRFKALKWVRPHIKRLIGLTGTPAPNGLMDLWAQVYLLDGGQRLEKSIGAYRARYFDAGKRNRTTIFNYEAKAGAEEAIYERISDICISMKAEDYLELPECIYNTVTVELDSKSRKAYIELEKKMLLTIDENTIDAGSAAVLTNKLLQLCNGAVYDDNRQVVNIHDCKLEAFIELLEGLNGKPALVFYNFKHDVDRIQAKLAKTGLRVRMLKTPEDQTAWNNGEVDILLAHPASAAYGLNLQDGGNHVIWFSLNWSLELYQQANKRLHRQGQKNTVIIHHLVTSESRDDDVIKALTSKEATQDMLFDSLKARIEKYKSGV